MSNKRLLTYAIVMFAVGIFGLIGVAGFYFSNYGSFVSSPGNGWMAPNAAWMGSSGMMGRGLYTTPSVSSDLAQNMMASFAKSTYKSAGEKIFLTSVDENGYVILPSTGAGSLNMMSNMMRPIACVNCHDISGKGGFVFPQGKVASADIRWQSLQAAGFDEAKFKSAVTEWLDDKGKPLSAWMPRWNISDKDLDILIAYLKTL